jgi:hypothetical protein
MTRTRHEWLVGLAVAIALDILAVGLVVLLFFWSHHHAPPGY